MASQQVVLRVDNLTKYFGEVVAVDGLSLEVYEGEVFGFLGPNGAGKTTSINMMCGLLSPDAGQVRIHDQPVRGGETHTISRVGVCPQAIILWSDLTCFEQLVFAAQMYDVPRRVACERAEVLLEQMGLIDKRNKRAKTLSGGMQRRLNLIMALVHEPDIIVLDEPEAGLDPQSRVLVRDYIKSLAQHKTVILTTHNMDEAERLADRVAIIDHGQLLKLDTPDALKREVGEGDVLEIELAANGALPLEQLERAKTVITPLVPNVSLTEREVVLRARGMVERLPAILGALEADHIKPGEVRLRESSLEDVFIAITGRRLRE
ncbi:MAG: ABC transporter ATP-binding protein [Chloroflexi bacterium]|nr:ABC transporter ATP-binding protein [Chloroflexota bacterium]